MKFMHKAALIAAFAATLSVAQEQRGEAKATVAGKAVAVEYGRPSLAGRDMLGQAKAGTPWRMGAGSPTSLKTEADLTFGSVALPKGSYVLTAVKDEKGSWTVIATNPDTKAKVAEMPLVSTTLKDSVEQFTIELTGKGSAGEFAMMWGTSKMATGFTAK
ncbi:MAG TPA: DUF2911 domain-containing protein [Vicinamibacteria bacterium]|nr:DUF2911 domain-containing protein [Vicinamibacteria bacterium]